MKLLPYLFLALSVLMVGACGPKKVKSADDEIGDAEHEQHAEAKGKLKKWLGEDAAVKVSKAAKVLGKQIATKTVKSKKVNKAIGKLVSEVFKQKKVKKKLDKISDKATSGVKNKLTLLGKAIVSGGTNSYKKKVQTKGTDIAKDILEDRLKNEILKDPRMSEVIGNLAPLLTIQGKLAAATIQSNLSPKVSQKLFSIALTLSVEGKSEETAEKVEKWISECEGHAEDEIEELLKDIGKLKSLNKAMETLAIEVLEHPTLVEELAEMTLRILDDDDAYKAAVKAYEYVAFDKSESKVRSKMKKLLALPVIDDELFKTLNSLLVKKGANAILEKHLSRIGEDEKMAELIDEFLITVLVTCGDIKI